MNQVLADIEAQCWNKNPTYFDIEKFAELIVAECVNVAIHKDAGMVATADVAGYMAAGRTSAARMIKQHFGIEE